MAALPPIQHSIEAISVETDIASLASAIIPFIPTVVSPVLSGKAKVEHPPFCN